MVVPEYEVVHGLTDGELNAETGEQLPDCEAMSLVNANVAIPINAAWRPTCLSDDDAAA